MPETHPVRRRTRLFQPRLETCEARTLLSGAAVARPVAALAAGHVSPLALRYTPLNEFTKTQTYRGESGGLYGDGRNHPEPKYAASLKTELARVTPRDAQGQASAKGRIGMIALGQSTTRMFFESFEPMVRAQSGKLNRITTVNAGQDGLVLQNWASTNAPWATAVNRVRSSGLTRAQVQVAWLQMAQIYPGSLGDFAARTQSYVNQLRTVVRRAKEIFPNLRVILVSSSMSTRYASRSVLPEPYAYEDAFAVRSAIQQQASGHAAWNWNPARGKAVAPILLWGPYVWGTAQPRSDGFSWLPSDTYDGVHPTGSGRWKVARLLYKQLTTDALTRGWFLK